MALDGDTSSDNDMVRHAVRHFADQNVVAVAGNLRARSARSSFVTRLQALEYALSIHLSRAGLDAFKLVNNLSGAFGIFRRDFLRRIGGWDSGTAEDLDLTLRIKKYFARHPDLRIRFEPRAMGHTDVPETFRGFLKQRLRWDGDLSYLSLRKYRHHLRPGLMGLRNFLALVWTGLLFQLALPFVLLTYTIYMLFVYPAAVTLGVLAFVYLFYTLLAALMYVEYWFLYSERRRQDLKLAWMRSEEHTSELQSRLHLVCRLLLEKKKKQSRLLAPTIPDMPLHLRPLDARLGCHLGILTVVLRSSPHDAVPTHQSCT